ncbi:hypothetical protein Pla22_11330 [Rubripirellula amarantea]|uniref:DUF721 domain-containing protein n=1 Tax=Rubripirellula amarantea TaxID=2527999 RepID=A0A5C5WRH5_9BACT|nr:DUF721 domain-containing protein [Rubripirellula amarantea]TWT53504.1 hypothetical protein Pla22_11330 [Rubripirellula amarantea]
MAKSYSKKIEAAKVAEDRPQVRRIGSLVNQLMARRGYAQVFAGEEILRSLISETGPEVGNGCSVGKLKAGVLHVYVTDSATLQELNFRKRGILKRLQKDLPDSKVTDIRFRIQAS